MESGQHWVKWWGVTCKVPNHYPKQCRVMVDLIVRNKFLLKLNTNTHHVVTPMALQLNHRESWGTGSIPCMLVRNSLLWNGASCFPAGRHQMVSVTLIARFMGPTWGPPGTCRPQDVDPINLAVRVFATNPTCQSPRLVGWHMSPMQPYQWSLNPLQ